MARQDKNPRSGFVIKLSSETAQKLADEEQQAKEKAATDLSSDTPVAKDKENEDISKSKVLAENSTTETDVNKKLNSEHNVDANSSSKHTSESKEADKEDNKASDASWGAYAPYITYEGEEAIYTDPSTQQKYTWSKTTNSWDAKSGNSEVPGRVYSYENDTHIYTEPDGTKSFWDPEKKAWIPKVDDDFLAFYQMSYGFVDNTSDSKKEKPDAKPEEKEKKEPKKLDPVGVKRKSEPQWFEQSEQKNTKVYVSNLPLDLTEEEFVDLMQKCGLVERDPSSQKMKIKLYYDKEQNCFKGDALCTYIKIESVDLALKLLDGSDYKGQKIKVERAHFQLKGEYNPALKPKKKKKKELEKIKKMQQKLFDWRPEKFIGERSKHERVVIVKNLFHPSDFDTEVQLILDYQQDLREEATKCGEVRKVVLYDRHPEGVAQITMKEPEMADAVVQLMNGRWFGKRQISAEIWDGRTKYRIAETDAALNQRIEKWDKFLEGKDEPSQAKDPKTENEEAKPDENQNKQTGEQKVDNDSSESKEIDAS